MNLKNKKLSEKLRNSLKDWILDSTSHGFPKIVKNERIFLKIMWTGCLLTSIGFCAYLVFRTLSDFLQYNVTTTIRQTSQIPIDFPAISICQNEMFLTEKSKEFIVYSMEKHKIFSVFDSEFLSSAFNSKYQETLNLGLINYFARLNALNYSLSDQVRQTFGYHLDDYLISCLVSSQTCTTEDFIWYFDQNYGNCYLFNTGNFQNGTEKKSYQQSNIGIFSGIRMDLINPILNVEEFTMFKGLHITLFDPKTKVNSLRGFEVSPRFQTNIMIKKKINTKIPYPYSECKNDHSEYESSLVYQATKKNYDTYSQDLCYDMCYQKYLISTCGCSDPNKGPYGQIETENCLSINQIFCVFKAFTEFQKIGVRDFCSKDCPLECQKTYYDFMLSFVEYPTNIQAEASLILMNKRNISLNYTKEDIKKYSLQINIFYDQLVYETIEETKQMEIVDLISNIGGILGLFIGISLLSFAELAEILIEIIFVIFESNKTNSVQVKPIF